MDKLKESIDPYYNRLDNAVKNFKDKSRVISTDSRLSKIGKNEKLSEVQTEHEGDMNALGDRFIEDCEHRLENISNAVNGARSDIRIGSIQARLKKGEDISSEETSKLLLHEMSENKKLMQKSSFQGMLYTTPTEQLKKTAQTLSDSEDVERLEWLQEMTALRGDDVLSNSLAGLIEGIKDSKLNSEQKKLKGTGERISKAMQLFDYALQRGKTGEFMDVRKNEIK